MTVKVLNSYETRIIKENRIIKEKGENYFLWMTKDLVKQEQLQGLKTQHETAQETNIAFAAAMLEQE